MDERKKWLWDFIFHNNQFTQGDARRLFGWKFGDFMVSSDMNVLEYLGVLVKKGFLHHSDDFYVTHEKTRTMLDALGALP